jgi:hypothetical protein
MMYQLKRCEVSGVKNGPMILYDYLDYDIPGSDAV